VSKRNQKWLRDQREGQALGNLRNTSVGHFRRASYGNFSKAPKPANTIQGTLRFLRVFHGALLLSMILYPIVSEMMALRNQANLNPIIWPAFILQGVVIAGIAIWIRVTRVRSAVETVRLKPDDAVSLQRWRSGSIICSVLFESIVLLGFALRFMGGTLAESLLFYVAGIALMLVYWPQEP
jgi:hypothetical protein